MLLASKPDLFPFLGRPQYPSSPEILLSAIAWSMVPRSEKHARTGLIYSRRGSAAHRKVRIEQTMPKLDGLEDFCAGLAAGGYQTSGTSGKLPECVAESVANALLGTHPVRGVNQASAAMGLFGALLQDPVGGLGTENPPNFARMLNTMYRLGGGSCTAGDKWLHAASRYAEEGQLKAIENALATTTLKPYIGGSWSVASAAVLESARPRNVPTWWPAETIGNSVRTPFAWFADSWDRLCSDSWSKSLPPRRWASWAVCVLRHALGFGFLWEANFFIELARGISDISRDPVTVASWALRPTRPLITHNSGGIAQMDVMPAMKQLLTKGFACREAVRSVSESLTDSSSGTSGSLAGLVESLREGVTSSQQEGLRSALQGKLRDGSLNRSLNNLIETVRYSLQARGSEETPDHSSLLKVVNRYAHVSPGPEWIVVMSGLSVGPPRNDIRLGDVRRSLDDLGFRPRIDFLLVELERAGLCASAPDGDDGILVDLGFLRS
jgi:hypothetical protein